jgi:hypothetical protein
MEDWRYSSRNPFLVDEVSFILRMLYPKRKNPLPSEPETGSLMRAHARRLSQ